VAVGAALEATQLAVASGVTLAAAAADTADVTEATGTVAVTERAAADTADVTVVTVVATGPEVILVTDRPVLTLAVIDQPYRFQAIAAIAATVPNEVRDRKALGEIFPPASRREHTAGDRNPMAEARVLEPRAIGARRKTDTIRT